MLSPVRTTDLLLPTHTSGYNHGCSDAQISDPSERYINQPEKGSGFHSDAFMQAYNDGFDACSGNSNNNDNSDSSSDNSNSNSNPDNSGGDTGSSKSFGQKHTLLCGVGPGLLTGTGHPLLGLLGQAICSK